MGLVLAAPLSAAELAVLAGRGVLRHTDGFAWQASEGWPDYSLRVHSTVWEGDQALTVATMSPGGASILRSLAAGSSARPATSM